MNNKIKILTTIYIDNFLLKNTINYLNRRIEIVKCKQFDEIILQIKNKTTNFCFMTNMTNFVAPMNIELERIGVDNRCIFVDNIVDVMNKCHEHMVFVCNDTYYEYYKHIREDILNIMIIIDTYNYNIRYKDNDVIFNSMNKLHLIFATKQKDIKNLLNVDEINEISSMMIEHKNLMNLNYDDDNNV